MASVTGKNESALLLNEIGGHNPPQDAESKNRLTTGCSQPEYLPQLDLKRGARFLSTGLRHGANPWICLALSVSVIMNITLSIVLIDRKPELCPAVPTRQVASCPDDWLRFMEKCYLFSKTEGNWTASQNYCSLYSASLTRIDSEKEKVFIMRYKGQFDHWIGLQRKPNQSWKWVNGTEFNDSFEILGTGQCAYVNDNDFGSSSCAREQHWIRSKPA